MFNQPLERQLSRPLVSFGRLCRARVEPRPELLRVRRPAIRVRLLALHMIDEAADVSVRPVGVMQASPGTEDQILQLARSLRVHSITSRTLRQYGIHGASQGLQNEP